MALEEVVNEGFLSRYRVLLDAEDSAFDELEHAYEDGDREHFLADLATWSAAIQRRWAFLARAGVPVEGQTVAPGGAEGNHGPGNHGPGNHGPGNHGPGNHGPGNHGVENVDALA